MDTLLHRFKGKINGAISGFDRLIFKGMFRTIMYAAGMQTYLMRRNVLNKDFKEYAMKQSKAIVESAEEMSKRLCNRGTTYIASSNDRKETIARDRQKENGIKEGLIGIWSCVESCYTFRSTYNPYEPYPILRREESRCKHLYYYFDDPTYGFMSIRLQTWAPYEIQIALNGREWLRRSLDANGCGYTMNGNKFLDIDNYELAQKLLNEQINTDFMQLLNSFLPIVFPLMPQIVEGLSYYWTVWQSEIAKDYIFNDTEALKSLMDDFLRYSMITGTGDRILKYFGAPVKPNGQPHANANPEILSRAKLWYEGLRARHWYGKNSVKFYNEHNVLRFETTMNDPTVFKVYRHSENQDKSGPKRLMQMRKGVADINVRAEVSKNIVNRFTEHMSNVKEKTSLHDLLDTVSKPIIQKIDNKNKRVRALDVFGKDLELIRAISDPAFNVSAITNKGLQNKLINTPWAKNMSGKKLSGRIGRHLLLLRKHGLIKKLPNQRSYSLTDKGRKISTGINAALASSVEELLKIAA